MEFTAQQIADILEGDIAGNPEEKVSKISKIEEVMVKAYFISKKLGVDTFKIPFISISPILVKFFFS